MTKIAALTAALCAFSLAAVAAEQGGISGGGGSVVDNKTLETYLAKHPADMPMLRALVKEHMQEIRSKLPEFAAELDRGFSELDWYTIDKPLDQLPFSRTKVPFGITHAGVQIEDNVYLQDKLFAALAKEPGEQPKLVLHELVRRIFLAAEGTNTQVTESSVYKATELLANAAKHSATELRARLEELGFQTRNIAYRSPRGGIAKRRPATIRDAVVVPVELKKPITLQAARAVVQTCLVGGTPGQAEEGSARVSLLGRVQETFLGYPAKPLVYETYLQDRNGSIRDYESSEADPLLVPSMAWAASGLRGPGYSNMMTSLLNAFLKEGKVGFSTGWHPREYPKGMKNLDVRELMLDLEGGLPGIEFQGAQNEPVYTPFGLTNTKRHVNQISIVANRNWVAGDGMVGLRNSANGVTIMHQVNGVGVPVQIDGKSYMDCLQRGFEEASQRVEPESESQLPAEVVTAHDPSARKREPGQKSAVEGQDPRKAATAQ